jgi:hypothetical protein
MDIRHRTATHGEKKSDGAWHGLTRGVMATEQKDSANLLGFDKNSWDEERHVWSDDVYWRQLSLSQQAAAENIGYTQEVRFLCFKYFCITRVSLEVSCVRSARCDGSMHRLIHTPTHTPPVAKFHLCSSIISRTYQHMS